MGTRALPDREVHGARPGRAAVRVLVVDDHVLVRESTAHILGSAAGLVVVGGAGTAEEALSLVPHARPHVAVVDIRLPGMSGLELAQCLALRFPFVRTLLLSAYDDQAYVARALAIGVSGYLLKTASAQELVDAVRSVCTGALVLDRAISERISHHAPPGTSGDGRRGLTPRERQVLQMLAGGGSNREMSVRLGLTLRTVESYVASVLRKLGAATRDQAVLNGVAQGLVEAPPE